MKFGFVCHPSSVSCQCNSLVYSGLLADGWLFAEDALQQIEDKQYAKPFEHDGRTIYKIGINFSSKTGRIDGWEVNSA